MIRPHHEGLILDQLRYAGDVRSFDEVPIDEAEVKEAEMALARQLIEQSASEEFDATQYSDEVREKMLELIQMKVDGQEITVAPAEEPATQIIDLMSALKASLSDDDRKPAEKAAPKSKSKSKKKAAQG